MLSAAVRPSTRLITSAKLYQRLILTFPTEPKCSSPLIFKARPLWCLTHHTLGHISARHFSFSCVSRSEQVPASSKPSKPLIKVIPGNFSSKTDTPSSVSTSEEANTMNIPVTSFEQQLPAIREHIRNAMFVAIDLEFSGISWTPGKNQLPTLQDRYAEMRKTATTYQVLQLGICPVEWDEQNARYVARPFNIYLNPVVKNKELGINRNITLTGDAVEFLLKNGFDFNAIFINGVQYLSHEEEKSAIARRESYLNRIATDHIPMDDKNAPFIQQCHEALKSWVDDKDSPYDFLNITTESGSLNSYQRRLIHQVVQLYFPGLRAAKKGDFMQIERANSIEQGTARAGRGKEFLDQVTATIGVRHIIDELFNPKRPDGKKTILVGHNLMMDLLYIYQTFIGTLPYTALEFASTIHQAFPTIIDTKYLATLTDKVGGTGSTLSSVWGLLKGQINPQIKLHPDFRQYETAIVNHEAGYDAYNCARIFIKLAARISSHYLIAGFPETTWTSPNKGLTDFITAITQSENFKDDVYFLPGFHGEESEMVTRFWGTLSNKLRVFGTMEGLYRLAPT